MISKANILKIQQIVRHVIVSKSVAHYAVRLVRGTRPQETDRDYVKHYLTWGAGPRACQSLLLGAKARALLDGRPHVSLDDVRQPGQASAAASDRDQFCGREREHQLGRCRRPTRCRSTGNGLSGLVQCRRHDLLHALPRERIMAAKRYLDARGLGLVARMELVARRAVEGFLSGLHPSPYFGSSVEYADHRPYSLGDELRSIDWKLLAKTDKYYVKLFEEETNTRATIVLDTSRSMSFASEGQNVEARIRHVSHRGAGLSDAAPERCRGSGAVRSRRAAISAAAGHRRPFSEHAGRDGANQPRRPIRGSGRC